MSSVFILPFWYDIRLPLCSLFVLRVIVIPFHVCLCLLFGIAQSSECTLDKFVIYCFHSCISCGIFERYSWVHRGIVSKLFYFSNMRRRLVLLVITFRGSSSTFRLTRPVFIVLNLVKWMLTCSWGCPKADCVEFLRRK